MRWLGWAALGMPQSAYAACLDSILWFAVSFIVAGVYIEAFIEVFWELIVFFIIVWLVILLYNDNWR